ncbi:MAG: sterol desaturase family protein [Polyangiales bacterium]
MPEALRSLSAAHTALAVFGFLVALTVHASALGFAVERLLPRRRIFAVPLFPGQYRFELLGNAVFLAVVTAAFTAALRFDVVRFGPGGALRDGLTFAAMLAGFQVYYWFLHRALHTKALVRFHRWHHRSQVTTPLTGQSVSFVESLGWVAGYVGLPWLYSRFAPVGFWGLAGYVAFNVTGNVFGHANVEPTARPAASRAATWFANAFVYHALHHARWNGHYSFQAAFMDRVMGTEWNDWPALYDRIVEGHPLESLKARGDAA